MAKEKHLLKLAEEMFNFDLKNYSYIKEDDKEWYINQNYITLHNIKQALLKGNFYIRVESVSSSGMSRKLKMAYIKNNKLYKISDRFILKLAGCDKNGRISGCGMDMCFSAQYDLFIELHSSYKKAHYQKRMPRYNNY